MTGPNNGLILYHYRFSPFARRITWYLALRGIDHAECIQPSMLPRPDVHALGVKYRRIPLMSIGRDVYCDTRLILRKLEQIFPDGALGASTADQKALERLLEQWTVTQVFPRAGQLLPTDLPLIKDPKFQADRKDFSGARWDEEAMQAIRPEALAHIREVFSFLETTLLADQRDWILKTEKPSLADIEAIWPVHWLNGLPGALPRDLISSDHYPRVFAWIERFDRAVKTARGNGPKPATLSGEAAFERIVSADAVKVSVQTNDPSRLPHGQLVEVWPLDTGSRHKDRGNLVGLNEEEIVLEVSTKDTGRKVHVHFPRLNYRLRPVQTQDPSKL